MKNSNNIFKSDVLKELMLLCGITCDELAALIDVAPFQIRVIYDGIELPNIVVFNRLCTFFHVKPSVLIDMDKVEIVEIDDPWVRYVQGERYLQAVKNRYGEISIYQKERKHKNEIDNWRYPKKNYKKY